MNISRTHSESALGLFSLILLFISGASSITYTAYSANQTVSDSPAQADAHSVRRIPIASKDIVYNPTDQKIYASVPSDAPGGNGNSIARIDPTTGYISPTVFVGSEPGKLALAGDGQTMYVALDGAGSVRRFDTAAQTPGMQFSAGYNPIHGIHLVNDLAVAPDNPNVVAVVRGYYGTSANGGVAVFDNGVPRPVTITVPSPVSDSLAFSNSGSTLYGGSYYNGLQTMRVNAGGVSTLNATSYAVGPHIKHDTGTVFSSTG